jgi:nucleoside-diphosphate-sugar epimerase
MTQVSKERKGYSVPVPGGRYLGEWYDTSEPDHPDYAAQKAAALHNCWTVSGIYGGFAVACLLGTIFHSFRAK